MEYYGMTDVGIVRNDNQDAYLSVMNNGGDYFHLVCDGIGGGNAGNVASLKAIQFLGEEFSTTSAFHDLDAAQSWIFAAIQKVNDYVFTMSKKTLAYEGMGTTLVGLFIGKSGKFVVNVGDSRAYLLTSTSLIQLTQDHTLAQELYKNGEIKKNEINSHPKRNVLTNAIGIVSRVLIDFNEVNDGDMVLLCSDGLHGYILEDSIRRVLQLEDYTLRQKAERLIELANNAGGYDNVTVILIDLSEVDNYE